MNETEAGIFRKIIAFYDKWRNEIIETDEQWKQFSDEVGKIGRDPEMGGTKLGWHLLEAVLDTFNDLYRNGMKPMPANYFGRDDIST